MITKLKITGKLHYHRKCDFQLSKRKLGYRTLLPLTAPILNGYSGIDTTYRIVSEQTIIHVCAGTGSTMVAGVIFGKGIMTMTLCYNNRPPT